MAQKQFGLSNVYISSTDQSPQLSVAHHMEPALSWETLRRNAKMPCYDPADLWTDRRGKLEAYLRWRCHPDVEVLVCNFNHSFQIGLKDRLHVYSNWGSDFDRQHQGMNPEIVWYKFLNWVGVLCETWLEQERKEGYL